MLKIKTRAGLAAGAAATIVAAFGATAPATAAVTGGNLACPAGTTTLKIDRAPRVGETITDGTLTVVVTDVNVKADGSTEVYGFSYTYSGAEVVQTIVKAGPIASRFSVRTSGTTDLNTRLGPGGRHYEISNVKFCYRA